jgi:hypothetical protein
MKKLWIVWVMCAVALCGMAAQPALAADKMISIVFDNGAAGLDATHARERSQLGDWMDKDLVRVFARYSKEGFQAQLISQASDFKPAPGAYLLNVKIAEYSAGSKAARIIVGFGAGGMTLKTEIELLDPAGKSLLKKEESCFSGRDWRNLGRKINEQIAAAVVGAIGK